MREGEICANLVDTCPKGGYCVDSCKLQIVNGRSFIPRVHMTFAQDVPFQVQVVAQVARMRWGPGPTFVVQHYANSGHILTILEVDTTSDLPWTWYYASTPSNVQSWIRSDLVRRDISGTAAQVSNNPTGTYPVVFDNLCNTTLFRPCQDGTDHLLWQAGYWAFDRYETWEHDGRNLDIVFHENACKADRLCSTREQWDAGLLEAQLLAVTATPDVTVTPVDNTSNPNRSNSGQGDLGNAYRRCYQDIAGSGW